MTLGFRKTFKGNESDILKYLITLRLIDMEYFHKFWGVWRKVLVEFFYVKVEKNAIKSACYKDKGKRWVPLYNGAQMSFSWLVISCVHVC